VNQTPLFADLVLKLAPDVGELFFHARHALSPGPVVTA
jgi:hypothetical protein